MVNPATFQNLLLWAIPATHRLYFQAADPVPRLSQEMNCPICFNALGEPQEPGDLAIGHGQNEETKRPWHLAHKSCLVTYYQALVNNSSPSSHEFRCHECREIIGGRITPKGSDPFLLKGGEAASSCTHPFLPPLARVIKDIAWHALKTMAYLFSTVAVTYLALKILHDTLAPIFGLVSCAPRFLKPIAFLGGSICAGSLFVFLCTLTAALSAGFWHGFHMQEGLPDRVCSIHLKVIFCTFGTGVAMMVLATPAAGIACGTALTVAALASADIPSLRATLGVRLPFLRNQIRAIADLV